MTTKQLSKKKKIEISPLLARKKEWPMPNHLSHGMKERPMPSTTTEYGFSYKPFLVTQVKGKHCGFILYNVKYAGYYYGTYYIDITI
jgi:hypothetical protein